MKRPNDQARGGRCGAVNQDGEPCVCSRWRGHDGNHRGPSTGGFYGGGRFEWEQNTVNANIPFVSDTRPAKEPT